MADQTLITAPVTGETRPPRKTLGFMGFSLGMVGDRIFRDTPALLLMIFMTDYLAIPPALAGVAIFIPKMLIVFVDPMVGALSDRLRTPWGRRRPLMLIGAILASLTIVMFFHVPRFETPLAQAACLSLLVFVGFTGFSLFSVPYLTMASEMADNEAERRTIMSWRVAFMAAGLSVSAFAGGIIQSLGGGFGGYATMSWIYAGICLVTMLITVASTREVPAPKERTASMSLAAQVQLVAANRPYMRLLLVNFAQKLAEGVGYGSFAYFCTYVVHQPLSAIGLVVASSVAGQILTQPLWLRASRRWSPTTLYVAGVVGWCLNLVLWLGMADRSIWWLIPLGLQGGAAAGGFLMVTLASLSNIMAADSAASGLRREGIYGGFWLGSEKLAFALGGTLVVGEILSLFGFVESSGGVHVTQSPSAILGIAVVYVGVNIVVYVASIFAMRRVARFDGARGDEATVPA